MNLTMKNKTTQTRQRLWPIMLLALLTSFSNGSQAATNELNNITYSTLPGDKIQIRLSMTQDVIEPASFTIDDPARIAFDFPATTVNLPAKITPIGVGVARSITAVTAGDRTRVVVNLSKLVGYNTAVEGRHVIITLNDNSFSSFSSKGDSTGGLTLSPQNVTSANILNVDFRRGEKGEGRVVITLADPNTAVDMKKRGSEIQVTLKNSALSEDLERRMDVIDFATPVKTVDAFNHGNDVRLIISASGQFDHIAYQADEKLTIDIKPVIKEAEGKRKKRQFGYTGERLSLNFQNIEVRAVLQLLADFTGINMVTSDTVSGNLTLRLKNVPWDQALDIVLKTKGLAKRQTGNVMLVAPSEEITAREKLELEATKQIIELAPLESETIQINYAKAADLAKLFSQKDTSLLSTRGTVTVDERTNKLLVQDTSEHIDAILEMVEELDIPVRQVLIESRIVLASTNFKLELGVRFGVTRNYTGSDGRTRVMSGSSEATRQLINGDDLELSDQWNVDLPVASASAGSIGLALARLPFGTLVNMELSAAQLEGSSETVSSPRVITSNQQEATITAGQEIPYRQASSSGAATVAFKKAVLELKVTPQITPDNRIIMTLDVRKDQPDFGNLVDGVPPINTQSVQTEVLINNGETVVLGGIYEQTKSKTINRVPFFGDLPILGVLFRNTVEVDDKKELLIFITPKILQDSVTL
ncbi:Type IV pilus biogenesis protein PilQ [hydrothermal vent metagenome]|uniref:Type IV pilus biogenesis protein PilQ n=1 Tax=hydrothermal vent metagenome TaxID=652676 RepID=A0A3B1BV01_9ZZZZ